MEYNMKSLQESLLDNENDLLNKSGNKVIIKKIDDFLNETYNFNSSRYFIKKKNNKIYVDLNGKVLNVKKSATVFNNRLFEWGDINIEKIVAWGCKKIQSLEGIPVPAKGDVLFFDGTLSSLKGCPKKINGNFSCDGCNNLKDLEGAPEECENFSCDACKSLTSLKGCPEKINGDFSCSCCDNLKDLEGAPKIVNGDFNCSLCGKKFSVEDVKKYSKVKKYMTL